MYYICYELRKIKVTHFIYTSSLSNSLPCNLKINYSTNFTQNLLNRHDRIEISHCKPKKVNIFQKEIQDYKQNIILVF